MKKPVPPSLKAGLMKRPPRWPASAAMAHFKARLERNKTRRRRDGDPPAALPVPADSPKGGGFSGGAAAALVFEED